MSGHGAAAVLAAPGVFEIRRAPARAPAAGEVLVRVEGCGVCGSDLAVWRGAPWFDYPRPPGTPGHEAWGRVEAVGPGVTALREGDAVACFAAAGFATRVIVPEREAVALPAGLASASFPGEPLACAVNVVARAGVGPEALVAVVGGGFFGCLLTQLAARRGARVTVFSRRGTSRAAALRCGARAAFPMDGSEAAAPPEGAGADGFDVVIEAAGRQEALDAATSLVRPEGRLVIAGYHQDGPRRVDMHRWNWQALRIVNAHERSPKARVEGLREAIRLVEAGLLDIGPLLTHAVSLERIDVAFRLLDRRPKGFMKAVVRP